MEYTVSHLEETLRERFTESSVDYFVGVEDKEEDAKMSVEVPRDVESSSDEDDTFVTYEGYHFRNVFAKVVIKRTGVAVPFLDWIRPQSDYDVYVQ